jgi:serine protease Do
MRAWWIPPAGVMGLVSLLCACHGQAEMTTLVRGSTPAGVSGVPAAAPTSIEVSCAPVPEGARDLSAMVARVRRAVVSVIAGRASGDPHVGRDHGLRAREHAVGSGMLMEADGLVLTSRHVIDGADDVRVELDDGRFFAGTVVARDKWLDVALLRLAGARDLPAIVLGSSDAAHVGEPVVAIGNPFGLGPSVRRGVLSAKARAVEEGPSGSYLQSDAQVNPGDSGGPLLDAAGRVIGVNTAILDHSQGISFAVPIDDVRAVLGELLAQGKVTRGRVGLSFQPIDGRLAKALGLHAEVGAVVTEIEGRGPAERAGVRAGDVVVAVNGRPIERAPDLAHELGRHKPGETLRLGLLRAGQQRTILVVLDRLEAHDDDDAPGARHASLEKGPLGFHALDADGGGARVATVDAESTMADDLEPGDVIVEVNRVPVAGSADLDRRLRAAPRPSTALLRVRRDHAYLYVGIELD